MTKRVSTVAAAAAGSLFLLPLLGLAAQALPAGSTSVSAFAASQGPGHAQQWRKAQAVKALLAEGRQVRMADGGTLTAAHRAELQVKLDRIVAGNY